MWVPQIFIGNSVRSLDLIKFDHMWYFYPKKMVKYTMILTPKISCNLDFHAFPFDSHECTLDLKNWISTSYRISLNSPKIYTNDNNGKEIGGQELKITKNHGKLDYNFGFKTLPSSVYVDGGYEYSLAQVKMFFQRTEKSRLKIFGGYHLTTTIFALLSLLSFSIQLDIVAGRMGMLLTLYLIHINTYNSLDAPANRGFSSIEIWFAGMQVPILLAILEYGILLAVKKFWPANGEIKLKNVDFYTFVLSGTYLLIFNGFYWFG